MTHPLQDYFDALARLEAGCPVNVPKGTKITNDAVSIEAGRGKGSIKKSRPVFAALIQAITDAVAKQANGPNQLKEKLDKTKKNADQYLQDLEAALARELCLLLELYEAKKQLTRLTGGTVLPIRGAKANGLES